MEPEQPEEPAIDIEVGYATVAFHCQTDEVVLNICY